MRELFSRVTDIEKGLLHTFIWLFRDPGRVVKDYVRGNQRKYTNPLTYFFIGTAVQLIGFWIAEDDFRRLLRQQMNPVAAQTGGQELEARESVPAAETEKTNEEESGAEEDSDPFEKLFGKPMPEVIEDSYISAMQQGYTYAALFCFMFPFAFLLLIFHRANGEYFQMGEMVVFSLFLFAQILIATGAMTPFLLRFGSGPQITVAMTTYVILPQLAHTSFFRRTWVSRLMTLLATGLAFVPFAASIMTIFLGTFLAKIGWAIWFAEAV